MQEKSFKIGTRNSPLALIQANIVYRSLCHLYPDTNFEIVPVHSNADWKKEEGEKPLNVEQGGKGLFAKEIETMLLSGEIDCGVHSLKDMASALPEGLEIAFTLPRANPFDAFISSRYSHISQMPEGAVIGTCSARRQAIALHHYPHLKIVPLRGNVQTRLDKVAHGQVDATFLALAGIERLAITDPMIHPMTEQDMLPACGQGIICIEIRSGDEKAKGILTPLHDKPSGLCATAERAVLQILDGSCQTAISAYATLSKNKMLLKAEIFSPDGCKKYSMQQEAECLTKQQAFELGQSVGHRLKDILPPGFLS